MKTRQSVSRQAGSVQQPWLYGRTLRLALAILSLVWGVVASTGGKNPKDDFCRRFAHQTTVIDDKLYIDGGFMNWDGFPGDAENYSNTWLGYHDLNEWYDGAANFSISLNKNGSVPTVQGGVLWGDSVNKRFYLYGGEVTEGQPSTYHIYSYDILNDHWDDHGPPNIATSPTIAAFGAGVGVSETGIGYYCGGWASNMSMRGWLQTPEMISDCYAYSYDSDKFTRSDGPDKVPRAEGGMVWLPAGDSGGMLVYFGGIVGVSNGSTAPQPLDEIFIFDVSGNTWYKQKATGDIPQNRARFCADVAWAPDRSSYNIYLWGGLSVTPPVVNATSFNDVYILTLPTFTWIKAYPPGDPKNSTLADTGHYSASCNMVKNMSQMFVIGGTFTNTTDCDMPTIWGQHTLWTGTTVVEGDEVYWALYNDSVTSNTIPRDIYSLVGGDKDGGATVSEPDGGFDIRPVEDLFARTPQIKERTPTRSVPGATGTVTDEPAPTSTDDWGSGLSTGAIVGIAIASAAGVAALLLGWFCIARRVHLKRRERQQSESQQQWRQTSYSIVSSMPGAPPSMTGVPSVVGGAAPSMMSQGTVPRGSAGAMGPSPPPSELPTRSDNIGVVSELPQEGQGEMAAKYEVSPHVSPMHDTSPGPHETWTPESDGRALSPTQQGVGH